MFTVVVFAVVVVQAAALRNRRQFSVLLQAIHGMYLKSMISDTQRMTFKALVVCSSDDLRARLMSACMLGESLADRSTITANDGCWVTQNAALQPLCNMLTRSCISSNAITQSV